MPSSPPSTTAGGFPIAAGTLGGAVLGFAVGEPTRGLLLGLAVGIVVALAIWWRGRR